MKNLLDEKGIQYHYVDASNITHELLTNLRMYSSTYPVVLDVQYFSTFNETLEHFHKIWKSSEQSSEHVILSLLLTDCSYYAKKWNYF